jgi:anti-sigma B factor antagonist
MRVSNTMTCWARTRKLADSAYLVCVSGELDLSTAPQLKQQLRNALEDAADTLVLDLSGVTFLDSATLSLVAGAHNHLAARRGRMLVVCPNSQVGRIFGLARMRTPLELHDSLGGAIDTLARPLAAA